MAPATEDSVTAIEVDAILAGCERFLTGGFVRSVGASPGEIPEWAWVNALAHGSREDLLTLASTRATELPPERFVWGRVASFVAAELLDHAAALDVDVAGLQREIVVPLELRALLSPIGPSLFLRLVLAGLTRRRPVAFGEDASTRRPG